MILVVDDHDDTRAALAKLLNFAGYQVTQAPDASQALRQMIDAPPALAILDHMMPDMTGLDLLIAMQSTRSLRSIPAILYSASGEQHLERAAIRAGAVAYFTKGEDFGQLLQIIRRHLPQSSPSVPS